MNENSPKTTAQLPEHNELERLFGAMPEKEIECLVFLVGLSGAGKTSGSNALSDSGFAVIDNLPVPLLGGCLELIASAPEKYKRTSIMLQVDSEKARDALLSAAETAREHLGSAFHLLFMDAKSERVVQRYNETRRPHPAFLEGETTSLLNVIESERDLLNIFKERANFVFDSSTLSVHDLKREVRDYLSRSLNSKPSLMSIQLVSFGFKRGVPFDCDLTLDVRFLPNPYFVDSLRKQTGLDAPVRDYVLSDERAQALLSKYLELLNFLLPNYAYEGKAYLKIGIGCTGGKHRSVALSEEFSRKLKGDDYLVSVMHRDLGRE